MGPDDNPVGGDGDPGTHDLVQGHLLAVVGVSEAA
jgi:hypothetical protein